jgi:predicted ribosomally synthesized peptide with nif11-like leader
MPIDMTKVTKEMLDKASKCETADELIAFAKASGITLTKEEAEAYMAEMDNMELDEDALDNVAGGYNGRGSCSEVVITSCTVYP